MRPEFTPGLFMILGLLYSCAFRTQKPTAAETKTKHGDQLCFRMHWNNHALA